MGVGITLAVRKKGATESIRYHRVPEMWRKPEKLEFVVKADIPWQTLTPNHQHTWLVPEHSDEYQANPSLHELFGLHSRGLETTRDDVVYDFDAAKLETRVRKFIGDYNAEVDRHGRDKKSDFPDHIKWSSRLKECLSRGRYAAFEAEKIRTAIYRPFVKRWVFFDAVLNQRLGQWPNISGQVIWAKSGADWPFFVLASNLICDLLPQGGSQCFPLSHLKEAAVTQFRQHYKDEAITKEEIFHYIYALLHHPQYRERYAANLKRELPRIPFAPDFHAFASAGTKLAQIHIGYETLAPWPLKRIETKGVPYTERVTKMKLSADKQSLTINESLTLANIPPETFEYRLGSRSALDWIVDQYQVKGESDPNREDDPGYIVRLAGQVVRVSIETVGIVKTLPNFTAAQ